MTKHVGGKSGALAGVLVVGFGAAVLWAQVRPEDNAASFAALTSEVRLLRVAVEGATRTQAETQALAVYLSAQQSRMIQLGARLDAVRQQLAAAAAQSRQVAEMLSAGEQELARVTKPDERVQAAEMVQMFKQQADQAATAERDLRNREAELQQASRDEETRWADLIARLQQVIRK